MGDSLAVTNLGTGRTVLQVGGGEYFHCALLDNGLVKCWGEGANGRTGHENATDVGNTGGDMGDNLAYTALGTGRTAVEIAVGAYHACAILDNGSVKCWGTNSGGALGLELVNTNHRGDAANEMGDNLAAVNLGTGRTAVDITAGMSTTCARLDNNTTKCWGLNSQGQLGLGDDTLPDIGDTAGEMGDPLVPLMVGTGRTVSKVVGGRDNILVVRDDGALVIFGDNNYGRLALAQAAHAGDDVGEMGSFLTKVNLGTSLTATKTAIGVSHTCAIVNTGQVKCWGRNNFGQLGLGDTTTRGNSIADMGDALSFVSLGSGRTAKEIALGHQHTCAILDNDQVKCWGNNTYGQLGYGTTAHRGDGAGEMGDALGYVDLGTGRTAKQIAAGTWFSCAILDNDTVKCWGRNDRGQLGQGNTTTRGDGGGEMGDSLAVTALGTGRTAKAIGLGDTTACVIMDNDLVKCWGRNNVGQLGQGSTADRGDGAGEMGDSLALTALGTGLTAKKLAVGLSHACVILNNDNVKCWGEGANGRLGSGGVARLGDGAGEMGDSLAIVNCPQV
jgi:alpha-tubulin suppressor-like RCC1 family protein